MVFIDKMRQHLPLIQLVIFLSVLLLFQLKLFTFAFLIAFALILYLVCTSQQDRVFAWCIPAYLIGSLLLMYGDRLMDEVPIQPFILTILNRFLLIIPILLLFYVSKKFNITANQYWQKPDWNARIYFPFIWRGFHSLSAKQFLLAALLLNFLFMSPNIFSVKIPFQINFFVFLIGFSLVNGIFEELLWRGILLSRMTDLAGERASVIFSGISFGFSHLMLGYSFAACLLFALGGIFYGALTVKTGSILPAVIWHFALNTLMILSGIIPYIN